MSHYFLCSQNKHSKIRRFVSEYIVYLTENDVKLKAFNVVGEKSKDHYVLAMLLTNDFGGLTEDEIIQEVTFEEVIKNQ
jgi:hypothetical protein